MKRKNPETSIEAYRSLDMGRINERYRKILAALGSIKEGTSEDIAEFMGVEPEVVWKRLSELMRMGLIYRPGNKRKMESGKMGFTWMKVQPPAEEKDDLQKWWDEYQREPLPPSKPTFHQPNLF
jgi:predicted transcriptional regulator